MEGEINITISGQRMSNAHKYPTDSHETRIAILEHDNNNINETLKEIRKDIKELRKEINNRLWTNFIWTLGTMFTLSCAGAAVLAKGFHWLG